MRSVEFIAVSAACMMLTAVGIDVMLPAFRDIRHDFGLKENAQNTAYIVTVFFWGQFFQIIFGPMSDRLGRLYVLRVGFMLYIVGSVVAALSGSLTPMIVGRFIAGAGASAVFMTIIAIVRDKFSGDKMARVMSFIFTVFLFTPVVAPFLGLAILKLSDWRTVFFVPPVFAVMVFFWSLRIEETLPSAKRSSTKAFDLFPLLHKIIKQRSFLRYTFITTLLFGGISSYVSNAEFIVSDIYKKPELFTWVFGCIGLAMAMGALLNSKLVAVYGAKKAINKLLFCYLIIAIVMLVGVGVNMLLPNIYFFFGCIALLLGINLAAEPNSSSLAMKHVGEYAGTASALYGTCFFFGGAMIGTLISYFISFGLIAMAIGFTVIGVCTFYLNIKNKE
ncbi:MFS transporter [Flavobacterium sp. NST-5]|uniref:MFS transporter n=1 Tax=Flavobacterium ichthyis TaxID=2698827 RepID=A0ABW9ZFP1_9FLAO|nr:MFS transporter [Flavobacterium ichthyis]NBL65593.1 MFS transporter [Flavobacterium ichthyis]